LCRRDVRLGGSGTSTMLRDVGSLAVSAASGHKSRVTLNSSTRQTVTQVGLNKSLFR
jgi:hypothetical protein